MKNIRKKHRAKKKSRLNYYIALFIAAIFLLTLFLLQPSNNKVADMQSNLVIKIESPQNKTYDYNSISLTVSVSDTPLSIVNSIDGSKNITECDKCTDYSRFDLSFPKGTHTIKVYAKDKNNKVFGESVTFTVSADQLLPY